MNNRTRPLALAAIFFLVAFPSQAQQIAPSQKPQNTEEHTSDRGLLLGLYFSAALTWEILGDASPDAKWVPDISDEPHGQYLTLWITKTGDSVKIRPVDGLFVPRDTGFWRVGSQLVRSTRDPASSYEEQFWAGPVSAKPTLTETDAGVDGRAVRLLTYVGSDYLSYFLHWEGGAGGWEYVYPGVVAVENLTKEKTIEQVLGPAASAAYKRKAKSLDHMDEDPKDEPCNCCTGNDDEWGIIHLQDHWQVFARFNYGTSSACAQGTTDAALGATLSKRLAPGGTPDRSWESLRKEVETVLKTQTGSVQHVFISPKQDLLVAVGRFGVAVLDLQNSRPHSVLKLQEFSPACIPVMEQWSLGRFVAGWDSAIQKEAPAPIPSFENP